MLLGPSVDELDSYPDLVSSLSTLPSRIVPTLSSLPMSLTGLAVPLYLITEVRAMTLRPAILETVDMSSSVMPSEKYSSLGSALILASGRTAIL